MGRRLKVDYLARVEGEGSLVLKIANDRVEEARFRIFEPPRFFEALLRGRRFSDAPDITARICGICPVAYQMSAVTAVERALGLAVSRSVHELRRLMYCGEWIESHALHIFFLHAPDFLGYPDAIAMAADYPEVVKRALQLKKTGNQLVALVGGREIHPVNVQVGGFYRAPSKEAVSSMEEGLEWARDAAAQAVEFVAGLPFPDFERAYNFVALRDDERYPLMQGRIVSSKGLNIDVEAYEQHFRERHVSHSNALHCEIRGEGSYQVGPLARVNLNFDRLTPLARRCAEQAGLCPPCTNPFKSIVARAVETVCACEEALRIVRAYQPPDEPALSVTPKAGVGHGATEAPRGILYHCYHLDDEGNIQQARIVPPTAQNQKTIEEDLFHYASRFVDLPDDKLTWQCEQAIRNYDPCISCATHFLNLTVKRSH